jgi:hypothetical protein
MKHKAFYEDQMRREGFVVRDDLEVIVYATIGPKRYRELSQVGFNMAIAEKETNTPPKHGSYQADMMHSQDLAEHVVYDNCCRGKYDKAWLKGFLDEFSIDNCKESILQRRAYQRLEETIRDNSYMVADELEMERYMSGEYDSVANEDEDDDDYTDELELDDDNE